MNVDTLKHTAGAARTTRALIAVADERAEQEERAASGDLPHTPAHNMAEVERLVILAAEFGEVSELVEKRRRRSWLEGYYSESPEERAALRAELIQVAAVAVAWIEVLVSEGPQ